MPGSPKTQASRRNFVGGCKPGILMGHMLGSRSLCLRSFLQAQEMDVNMPMQVKIQVNFGRRRPGSACLHVPHLDEEPDSLLAL